ncbi:DNA polymerase III subunit alpha [Geochorda subterranea]|uniref:DNA polymerase III subunit alpha n=1 Tax=Geochorda subterranea TaxID=3109564 RepID=A0ABZ1BMP8_9FIRM|nr:DNA polymerase III subunit alpha [Limnochorda sp. LNt]WRP14096.1 DNA polymerase III subunit alpha [Limnochorda sp. LNt]
MAADFVHLHVHTPFSFLDGASSIDALLQRARDLGMEALAITDHDTLSGVVRFTQRARTLGIKPIVGVELTLQGGHHLVLLARDRTGYANLCQIVTDAHLHAPRRHPQARWETIARHARGLVALTGCRRGELASRIFRGQVDEARRALARYRDVFGEHLFVELQDLGWPHSRWLVHRLAELAREAGVPVVATNDVHYARKADFPVHDALTCVRTRTTLEQVHPERPLNAEQYLKSAQEMAALFAEMPEALHNAARIARMCEDDVLPLGESLFPAYPDVPAGQTATQLLRRLVYEGAQARYGRVTPAIRDRLDHELAIIEALGVADYFLVAHDIVQFARQRGIRTAGRGSAADSAVAYVLSLTDVDAIGRGLLFERFLSLERAQRPDIDLDFDARHRDEVAAYVYRRYGPEHVASVATYNTFQARSALREMGKVLGYPEPEIDALAKRFPHIPADAIRRAAASLPELRRSELLQPVAGAAGHRYELLFDLAEAVAGFPRHLGTHLGGLILSAPPITQVVPLQLAAKGMTVAQFDKDDVEAVGFIKLDLLSLRMLGAVDDAVRLIRQGQAAPSDGGGPSEGEAFSYERIPLDDAETYRMLAEGETVGVFQLESPAQRALQGRLGARHIEDIVASVALIRPGPIKGNMVEPFIARRKGLEPVPHLHPVLERILAKTYGVVLFQEQVIEIATAIAGFTPGEADRLRRAMTHFRSQQEMEAIGQLFVERALARGVEPALARTIFSYIVAYAGYGFCEAHAAAFATTAYKTAYLLRHHPAEFYAALLNNQPMGFYPPHTLVTAARCRGVTVLGPDVNRSEADYQVERLEPTGAPAIRVPLKVLRGLGEAGARLLLDERARGGPYRSLADLCRRVELERDGLESLIMAGALDGLHPNRRALLWALPAILQRARMERERRAATPDEALRRQADLGLSADAGGSGHPAPLLEDFSPFEKLALELYAMGFSPDKHLLASLRPSLTRRGVLTTQQARRRPRGAWVQVAGLSIRPHRPPTRSGRTVVFLTLEDEEGLLDVTLFEPVYQRWGHLIFTRPALIVTGRLERRGRSVSLTAAHVRPLDLTPP